MIRPWPLLESEHLGDFRIFSLREDKKQSPRTGESHGFYVLDAPNWVNVLALTPDDHLVMVEQYRHGTNTVELEVPGGVMEPHDSSPVECGVRELREETGYEGGNARVLAAIAPNPAIMSNTCFVVIIDHCHERHDIALDSGEDLITRRVPIAGVPDLVAEGKIRHSLVLVALYHLDLMRRADNAS